MTGRMATGRDHGDAGQDLRLPRDRAARPKVADQAQVGLVVARHEARIAPHRDLPFRLLSH